MSVTRRTIVRSAAWTIPAITAVSAAPAFATSVETPVCDPKGCKFPGRSNKKNIKSYRLEPGCGTAEVESVTINGNPAVWDGRYWWLYDQPNSKSPLPVTIQFANGTSWNGVVKFLPCKGKDC